MNGDGRRIVRKGWRGVGGVVQFRWKVKPFVGQTWISSGIFNGIWLDSTDMALSLAEKFPFKWLKAQIVLSAEQKYLPNLIKDDPLRDINRHYSRYSSEDGIIDVLVRGG